MTHSGEFIASEIFLAEDRDGAQFPIRVEVERPVAWGGISPNEWACRITVAPWFERRDVHGEGSLQALCLALQMVQWELSRFVDEGGKFGAESGERLAIRNYWPPKPF
jgi:hypothetical protein